jgi:hypothetical protein
VRPERVDEKAQRITREFRQTIHGTPAQAFPLLCPVRERDWAEGWECAVLHSECGFAEQGAVFTTPHHGESETVWVITGYDSPRRITFVRVTPGETAVDIAIDVAPLGDNESTVDIRYTYTSLGPLGDKRLAAITEEAWRADMEFWERGMNHYLATGEMLRSGHE